jgi:hypothetical protein
VGERTRTSRSAALVLLIAFLALTLPAWTLLSVATGIGITLLIKRPVTIAIGHDGSAYDDHPPDDPEVLPEATPHCCYCHIPFPTDETLQEEWVSLCYSRKPSIYACSENHLERFFIQGT